MVHFSASTVTTVIGTSLYIKLIWRCFSLSKRFKLITINSTYILILKFAVPLIVTEKMPHSCKKIHFHRDRGRRRGDLDRMSQTPCDAFLQYCFRQHQSGSEVSSRSNRSSDCGDVTAHQLFFIRQRLVSWVAFSHSWVFSFSKEANFV